LSEEPGKRSPWLFYEEEGSRQTNKEEFILTREEERDCHCKSLRSNDDTSAPDSPGKREKDVGVIENEEDTSKRRARRPLASKRGTVRTDSVSARPRKKIGQEKGGA